MTPTIQKDTLRAAIAAIKAGDTDKYNALVEPLSAEAIQIGPQTDPELVVLVTELQAQANLYRAKKSVIEYAHFLLACQEPLKAEMFLLEALPVGLEDDADLLALRRKVSNGLAHLSSFEVYKEMYEGNSVTNLDDDISGTYRGQMALAVAKTLKPGAAVLSIGPYAAKLEERILQGTPESTLHCVEMAKNFEADVLARLQHTYPNRVTHTRPRTWNDFGVGEYDLILLFEVLEHLRKPVWTISKLLKQLKPGGRLLVSVPVGYKWIEYEHVIAERYGHVRAYTAQTLRNTLTAVFSPNAVDITEGPDRCYVAVCAKR